MATTKENGTFIPYRIGQTFYNLQKIYKDNSFSIQENRVSGLQIKADCSLKIRLSQIGRGTVYDVTEEVLLKNYYSNLDDAMIALKEANKDNE